MKQNKKVMKKINEARANNGDVRLNIRLSKNGQFSSVSGKVKDIKVSLDGNPYLVVKPTTGDKTFQSVPLENILAVVVNGEVFKR